jgi:hypothetical protein
LFGFFHVAWLGVSKRSGSNHFGWFRFFAR